MKTVDISTFWCQFIAYFYRKIALPLQKAYWTTDLSVVERFQTSNPRTL